MLNFNFHTPTAVYFGKDTHLQVGKIISDYGYNKIMMNRNGLVDTGILLEHKQPEKVRFYKLDDGTFLIDIPEMTEIDQSIDVTEMFK